MAMIVSRVIAPASKLATAKALDPATAASSLGVELGLGEVDESELYAALDWLCERQGAIEAGFARRHLKGGTLVLYDVSASYVAYLGQTILQPLVATVPATSTPFTTRVTLNRSSASTPCGWASPTNRLAISWFWSAR